MSKSISIRRAGLLALAAATSLTILGLAAPAAAALLVLDCKVHASRPDHGRTEWTRRIIVDHATRTVKILDDFGSGFAPRAEYPLVGENLRRITLEAGAGKLSYLIPHTGEYSLVNARQRFKLEGHCTRAG